MKAYQYIVCAATVAFLSGCGTTNIAIDDAYHWSDEPHRSAPKEQAVEQTAEQTVQTSTTPTMEYINVQDTTVTIRINR